MKSYLVTWEMDIDAESPLDAARQAWAHMRRPDSTANSFGVIECDSDFETHGDVVHIDLQEEDDNAATSSSN